MVSGLIFRHQVRFLVAGLAETSGMVSPSGMLAFPRILAVSTTVKIAFIALELVSVDSVIMAALLHHLQFFDDQGDLLSALSLHINF